MTTMSSGPSGNYMKIIRIATAAAIIQNKAKNLSGEEYTKYLQLLSHQKGAEWKTKLEKLEDQVLLLKQNLIEAGHSDQCISAERSDEIAVYPTLPYLSDKGGSIHITIKQHTNFLSSTLRLKGIISNADSCEGRLDTVTRDSVVSCLKHVRTFLTNKISFPIHIKDVLHVIQLMSAVVKMSSLKTVTGEIIEEIMKFADEILENIMFHDTIYSDDFYQEEQACQILMILGKSKALQLGLLRKLVTSLFNYSERRRTAQFRESLIDPVEFENIFYVFKVTEGIFRQVHQEHGFSYSEENIVLFEIDIQDVLDDVLFHIADDVPVFAIFMWRLKGLLAQIDTKASTSPVLPVRL